MDINFIESITCDFVKTLQPYESARRLFSGGQYWLNANESPFSNEFEIDQRRFNRYPDCQPPAVLQAYASYAGLVPEQVLVSRGADEGIELLIRAFCNPGRDQVLICPPTYGMYAISARTFNVGVASAPLLPDFSLDLETMQQFAESGQAPKLVFLCSPNNPTGTLLPEAQVNAVLEMFQGKALVVLDEAYIEFSVGNAWHNKLTEYGNLVVLRTLSKAFALAGIRCGFILAAAEIIQVLLKVIAPYPVPDPVAQIASQALSSRGLAQMQKQVAQLQQEQGELAKALQQFPGFELVGGQAANFILFRTPEKTALMQYLVDNGMLIRDQSKQLQLHDCLRVSIGTQEQNRRLLQLISTYFEEKSQ